MENSGWLAPISDLKVVGRRPAWKAGGSDDDGMDEAGAGGERVGKGVAYRPLKRPSAILRIWHSRHSAGSVCRHSCACVDSSGKYRIWKVGSEKTVCRTDAI